MAVLFLSETLAFARSNIVTSIAVDDQSSSPQIRINFEISFLKLKCEFLAVDVLDSIGANRQNITKNVEKYSLNDEGEVAYMYGRNREQREVRHEEVDEEELDEEPGEHPYALEPKEMAHFFEHFPLAFINFYAPWCVWCQRLHPTWDKFAKQVKDENMKVGVATVDCVEHKQLCSEYQVHAFPTLRWFEDGQPEGMDYKADRTVDALMAYTKSKIQVSEKVDKEVRKRRKAMQRDNDVGCKIRGHLMVNRVPGNFHVEARSLQHNLNSAMTDLSHKIHSLTFGEEISYTNPKIKRILKQVPEQYKQFSPLNDKEFINKQFHQAFHHNLKVVSTTFEMGDLSTYQILAQSQIVHYDDMNVPEARFSYDISPMGVIVKKQGRKWYDYVTSICAIIGGTFTTLGLIDASLYRVFKSKKL